MLLSILPTLLKIGFSLILSLIEFLLRLLISLSLLALLLFPSLQSFIVSFFLIIVVHFIHLVVSDLALVLLGSSWPIHFSWWKIYKTFAGSSQNLFEHFSDFLHLWSFVEWEFNNFQLHFGRNPRRSFVILSAFGLRSDLELVSEFIWLLAIVKTLEVRRSFALVCLWSFFVDFRSDFDGFFKSANWL